ncbi:hypothetical protein IW261DRAFT_163486 [Armillaria novae-zelandiae]|uniref:Heterokaryon incompatibility domain-containing protein n=1 Tax=Armillaria novae-zelandiae TaxID=153914 RepID=A0AA39UEB7_9AGAR|nr:hypothetical protein IW261DRAFT_163486 [Armillaria novae-zelandiae]
MHQQCADGKFSSIIQVLICIVSLLPPGRYTVTQRKAVRSTTAYYRTMTMVDSESGTSGMASTSGFTGYWARFKARCESKKWIISNSWQNKKRCVSKWFAHSEVSLWYDKVRRRPPIYHEHPNLPKITLTALAETGRAELTTPVPKQRSYTELNAALGTSYSLGSKALPLSRKTTLRSILKPYVARNDDFGTVYSHLRRFWYSAEIEHTLHVAEEEDGERRKKVLVHGRITTRQVPPRRLWDLYANRVVPYWFAYRDPWGFAHWWGISHAWVDEQDRVNVRTPINGSEWPVPMPNDANLDLIRIEMLNLGAQYAWLDVLCLRQEGGKGEHLRLEEWKLDVPTIGGVYSRAANAVCYFNGLGRPLHLTPDYFESNRCWFRRAWTLQEITEDAVIGGETGVDIAAEEVQKAFDEQLARLRDLRNECSALELVSEMRNRVSSKPLDKVAGLAYLLYTYCIPIYDAEMSDVDAWEVLVDVMSSWSRAELFFLFPEPGNGRKYWRPSWPQIMTMKHGWTSSMWHVGSVEHEDTDQDSYEGYFIKSADVRGMDEALEEEMPRQGEMFFKPSAGVSCTFKILADHVFPIPDGSYTVICAVSLASCVVGWLREGGKFEKLSVFRFTTHESENFRNLGLAGEEIILS